MEFRLLASTIFKARAAKMLSWSVAFVLFAAQLIFIVPAMIAHYYAAVDTLQIAEQAKVTAALQASLGRTAGLPELLLDDSLVGLVVTDSIGRMAISAGNTGGFNGGSEEVLKATSPSGLTSSLHDVKTATGEFTAATYIDTGSALVNTLWVSVALVVFALLASFAGTVVALMAVGRLFIKPLDELVLAFRVSREESDGKIPEPVEVEETNILIPLADEFNSLIEEQKKSARQVKVKQQYLEFAAHHDPLTHLPNRLMFEDALKKTVSEAVYDEQQFAIFLVDLDNFKFFNDQYGHLVGDKMVSEVGNRLRAMMRDIDLVARLDGDEFVVIQKDVTDRASAEEVARRLMNVATAPYEYRGFTLKAAVSVGISCFPLDVHPAQDEEMLGEEVVNNAAVALQEAKSNGKNQYQLFNEKMRSRLTARIRLEQDLKLALQDEQFEVYYQPKINIHTRELTGAEALVRWRHPVNGFISPEAFVPVAEEAGLIIELGEWILRTACTQTRELQDMGYGGLNVAVNISAVQFTDGNLLPMVSKALEDSQLSPEHLELEITESAVMHDPEEVILSLHELSRFGMRLAIDDFGTGYSSLAYLKRFPVHTLKIDRAFITDISSDNDDVAIVEAVLGLGKHFNMKVVAEGVEDEDQLTFLKSQGCDIAQGYFISKPLSAESYVQWVKRWPYGVQAGAASNVVSMNSQAALGKGGKLR